MRFRDVPSLPSNGVRPAVLPVAQIEALEPLRFILLVGAIGGVLQAIPVFLHVEKVDLGTAHVIEVAIALIFNLSLTVGAACLWWFAVRRRFAI